MSTTFVVDRVEGSKCILVAESDDIISVDKSQLLRECCQEGAIFHVPRTASGDPDWSQAVRSREEESRLRDEMQSRLARLRSQDSGGNLDL